jgi:hypothetical protein
MMSWSLSTNRTRRSTNTMAGKCRLFMGGWRW